MRTSKLAVLLAVSTIFSGAAMAQEVRDGSIIDINGRALSEPARATPSSVTRASVQAQGTPPEWRNTIAAEGLGNKAPMSMGQRDRADVRAEAQRANQASYAARAQVVEGVSLQ